MGSGNRLIQMSSIEEIQSYLSNDLAIAPVAPVAAKERATQREDLDPGRTSPKLHNLEE